MADDLRYSAAVSRNTVRALRAVALEITDDWRWPDIIHRAIAEAFLALADELEAGTEKGK